MSELSDLQSSQIEFDCTRVGKDSSLWEHHDRPENYIPRLKDELLEFEEAIQNADCPRHQMEELADTLIFLTDIAAHLSVKHGLPITTLSEVIADKIRVRDEKYTIDNFANRTIEEGIAHSRTIWKCP